MLKNHKLRKTLTLACIVVASCTTASRPDLSGMSFSAEPLIGKVVWHDLITEDIDAARHFYGGLFGWTFEQSRAKGGRDYWLARAGSNYVAGMVAIESPGDGQRISRWLPYISVADVDDALARSVSKGANVAVSARNVSLGRVAAIQDSEGAVIGFARSAIGDPDDRTTAAGPGRVIWTELLANDAVAAAEFYRLVVGYDVRKIERRGGKYTILASAGADRAGVLQNPADEWKPAWLTYFGVSDPAEAAVRAESLGGTIVLGVSPELRESSMAVVADPSGALLVLQKWSNP